MAKKWLYDRAGNSREDLNDRGRYLLKYGRKYDKYNVVKSAGRKRYKLYVRMRVPKETKKPKKHDKWLKHYDKYGNIKNIRVR